jgi:glycosyltransferase involved in cell wall biosynthesis
MNTANAAIFYQKEAFTTGLAKLMGRNAAGAGFLAGYARHAGVKRYIGYARDKQEFENFRSDINAARGQRTRECAWVPHGSAEGLAAAGALFVYAPGIHDFCWQRRAAGAAAWSVIGLTHTISSDRVMDGFGQLLTAPVEPWDALICTSAAVKRTVEGVLDSYGEYLGERLGAVPLAPRPELPVIPLGVDCDAYAEGAALARARQAARAQLQLGEDEVAFLFLGRLSYHAKVHPLPMYLALEAAAQQCGKPLVLILAGYFFNDDIRRAFLDGAQRYCPSVRLIHLDARKPEVRDAAWAAADVFTSLSDNIQESFGLAPVEAMAAGLPVVVSDWDGYRDTVVHGETGFAVPTAMPAARTGAGEEFAARYFAGIDSYDQYIGRVGQCTAVDVGATTEAYLALIADPELRRRMGTAGRRRALGTFDWSVIVPAYQALWTELAARRAGHASSVVHAGGRGHPLRGDPFEVFRAFPTLAIGAETLVECLAAAPLAEARRIAASNMNNYALVFMLAAEELEPLFAALAPGRRLPVRELETLFPAARRGALLRTLGWLAKGNVVRLAPE